jgi:hypothetical protein
MGEKEILMRKLKKYYVKDETLEGNWKWCFANFDNLFNMLLQLSLKKKIQRKNHNQLFFKLLKKCSHNHHSQHSLRKGAYLKKTMENNYFFKLHNHIPNLV